MNSYRDDESEGFDIEDLVNLAYSSDHSSDEEPPMATCPTAPPSREDSDESDESDNDASSNEDDEVPPAQAADFPVEIDTDSEVEKVLLPPSTQRPAATPIETTPGPATLLVETPKEAVRGTSTRGRGGGRGRGRGRGGSTPPCTPRNERPSSSFSSPSSAGTSSGGTRTSTPASSPGSLPTKSSPSSPSPESRPTKRKRTLSQLSVPSPSEVATNMGESIVQAIAATATPVPQEKTYKRKPKPAPAATESDQSEAPESEAAQQPVPATSSPKTTSPKKASRAKPTKKVRPPTSLSRRDHLLTGLCL